VRWLQRCDGCFSNGSNVGAGNVRRTGGAATGRRWHSCQPEAPAPLAPADVAVEPRKSCDAWRSAGRTKFWVGPETSMPVHRCANSASCARIAASGNL
jgi:hypothetical protein